MPALHPPTLIIPGLDGSRQGHWQQWWLDNDPTAKPVVLTELHNPVPRAWEVELIATILDNPGAVLVGHSLGAVLIARVLTQWPHLDVTGALLVAPAEDASHPRAKAFTPLPELSLRRPATVVASRNDPWMSVGRARELSRHWQARFVDLGRAGHINIEAGFGPWPLGLALRDDLVERAQSGQSAGSWFGSLTGARAAARSEAHSGPQPAPQSGQPSGQKTEPLGLWHSAFHPAAVQIL